MMSVRLYWQEETPADEAPRTSDRAVDVVFALDGRTLPVDHAWALGEALREACAGFADDPLAGPHLIHPAASGNGWMSPQDGGLELFFLPRRARLVVRVSVEREAEVAALAGRRLDIGGHELSLGRARVRPLRASSTVYSRYVATAAADEPDFLAEAAARLEAIGIRPRRLVGGREHRFRFPAGVVVARSLLVADLRPEESLRLQEAGIGPHRGCGLGLFVPYKEVGGPVAA